MTQYPEWGEEILEGPTMGDLLPPRIPQPVLSDRKALADLITRTTITDPLKIPGRRVSLAEAAGAMEQAAEQEGESDEP